MCTQLIGGYLSHRFGGRKTLALSCALWSFFTALTPLVASNLGLLITCRIFLGLSEGVGFPSIMAVISTYIPPKEHSRSIAFVLSGSYLGAVIAYLVSSSIIENPNLGWRFVFYLFGFIGLFWIVPWVLFEPPVFTPSSGGFTRLSSHDDPNSAELSDLSSENNNGKLKSSNPTTPTKDSRHNSQIADDLITDLSGLYAFAARSSPAVFSSSNSFYLEKPITSPSALDLTNNDHLNITTDVPWKLLFSKREIWAIILVQFCQSWSYWLLINWLPTYYKDQFKVDIKQIGYFAVVPYVVQGFAGVLSGIFGDYLIAKGYKKLFVRKFMQAFGMISMALFMMLAVLVATDITQGMFFITLAMGLYCTTFAGVSVNQLDIAPSYAAIVYGIGNTAAQLPGIIGVWFTGLLLDLTDNNWLVVFSLASFISVVGAFLWILMAGANVIIH